MASWNKFQPFVEKMPEKSFNLGSDTLKLALSTSVSAAWTQLSDVTTQAVYTNCSSRNLTVSASSQTSGTYKLVVSNITLTASGGTVGPFQYIIVYDDTATNDELMGYYDYGSALTLNSGESLGITFDATNGVIQIT